MQLNAQLEVPDAPAPLTSSPSTSAPLTSSPSTSASCASRQVVSGCTGKSDNASIRGEVRRKEQTETGEERRK
eukprot:492905-Hanusia_phi.AAC.1